MSARLVIESTGFGVRGGLVRDGRLAELVDVDDGGEAVTERLFRARVRSVDAKLNAAFLDIGQPVDALLNAKDARFATGDLERRPITRLVREGQILLVQGVREGEGGKGARVTTDIKLFGFHLVWRPLGGESVGPARGRERQELQARGAALFAEASVALRKLAVEASDAALASELAQLRARWQAIQQHYQVLRGTGPVSGDEDALERLVRALAVPALHIAAAEPELLARLRALLDGPLAGHGITLERLDPERGAFEQTEVGDEFATLLAREVPLPGGGRLLIEPTAAVVAIDVDGGGRTALDADLAAAAEIARQVRLRNLGGSIIIDFIDLAGRPQRQRLEAALARAFRDDPLPVQIHPLAPAGLVQLSRARRGRALSALMLRDCPACAGTGRVPSLRAAAEQLLTVLRRIAPPAVVRCAADLAAFLQDGGGAAAWRRLAPPPRLVVDPALPPGTFSLEAVS
jgi:ribonuclease G